LGSVWRFSSVDAITTGPVASMIRLMLIVATTAVVSFGSVDTISGWESGSLTRMQAQHWAFSPEVTLKKSLTDAARRQRIDAGT
jgi:hypothetical protein